MKQVTSLVLFFTVLWLNYSTAQTLSPRQEGIIDSLTGHWNQAGKPGGAMAILQQGKLLIQTTRGLADAERKEKISPHTSFPLAQLSHSFIAYALLQLEDQGKLSLDDPINRLLPELEHLPNTLTIKHLLQQSSGMHDFVMLKNILGWSNVKPFSIADALSLLSKQETLAFRPGTEFAYSRSNMLLAAEIVGKVSGKSFSGYMRSEVFRPLGMDDSFVLSSQNQRAEKLAKSYRTDEQGILNLVSTKKETYAGINIAASIEDMVKWERNLAAPREEAKKIVAQFNKFVVLDNGLSYSVPQGKLTYGQRYIHKERGLSTAMSTGGIDGFASAIFNFPSEDFTTITLSNNGEPYNGYIGMISAHTLISDAFSEPTSIDFEAMETIPLNPTYHQRYEGHYWDALGELSREIRIEEDTLRYIRSNGFRTALLPLSKDRFQMKTDFDDKVFVNFSIENGTVHMSYEFGEATPIPFVKYETPTFAKGELQNRYAGTYYCKALGISYTFASEAGSLIAKHEGVDRVFSPITEKIFAGDQWYMRSIEFELDASGNAKGFYVRNDAIRNLWFERRGD